MIYLKKEKEVIKERTVVEKEICDICKEKDIDDFVSFDRSVVNINAKIGEIYPEGDMREGYIISCCDDCFLDKVKPLLEKAFNIEFRKVIMDDLHYENFDRS